MEKVVLFCKSYRGDLDRVKVQFESITKHNKDNIPYYICIPREDESLFRDKLGKGNYNIIFEDDVAKTDSKNKNGHYTQQIYKLMFAFKNISEFYFLMDSDSHFIRDFGIEDFFTPDGVPYITMHECKDLLELSKVIKGDDTLNEWFKGERLKIMDIFGRKGKLYDYSGSGSILFSSKVIKELKKQYMDPNKLSFQDLLDYCTSENTWVGEFLLQSKCIEFMPCAPPFKTFHYVEQYQLAKQLGLTQESFSVNYLGITLQSNWGAPLTYED